MAQREGSTEERTVRVEEAGKNGSNGRNGHLVAEGAPTGENAVERSLEDFIARANSTFIDADGWDLGEEARQKEAAEHALAEAERLKRALADAESVRGELARAREELARAREEAARLEKARDKAEAQVKNVAASANVKVERTEVVARAAVEPPPPAKRNYGLAIGMFVVGGALSFGIVKITGGGGDGNKAAPAVTQPATVGSEKQEQPEPQKVEPQKVEKFEKVEQVTPPPTDPAQPPTTDTQVTAPPTDPAQPPTTDTQATKDPGAPVVEPIKTDEPKKQPVKDPAAEKPTQPKGGIQDPFAETPPPPKKAPPKKKPPVKKKPADSKPKGGIVDPF
jgi:hypothetical protein